MQEDDEGWIEYKQQLLNLSEDRVQQLISQMKYRTREGSGECVYKIGVADSGHRVGLQEADMLESVHNVCRMAAQLAYEVVLIRTVRGEHGLVFELLIRQFQHPHLNSPLKILMIGQHLSGKSTLLAVLITGDLDDGQGQARIHVLNHKHELLSGSTSSISQHFVNNNHLITNPNVQIIDIGHQ